MLRLEGANCVLIRPSRPKRPVGYIGFLARISKIIWLVWGCMVGGIPSLQAQEAESWADSVLSRLSTNQRLQQLVLFEPTPESEVLYREADKGNIGGLFLPATLSSVRISSLKEVPASIARWRADSLRFLSSLATKEEEAYAAYLLFSSTDTSFLQRMGELRARQYLRSGISLLYVKKNALGSSMTLGQSVAFAHYVKGMRRTGLLCINEVCKDAFSFPLAKDSSWEGWLFHTSLSP